MGVSVFKAIRSPVAKIIYILLAAAFFIGFGVLTAIQPTQTVPKIEYGKNDIYSDEFFLVVREFQNTEGDENQLMRNAFDMMLARKSVSVLMEHLGFNLTDDMISAIVMGSAGLQGQQDYMNLIRSVGATRKSFENYVRDSYYFTKFQDLIVRVQTIGDLSEFQEIISWIGGLRNLSIAEIKKTSFEVNVSDQDIKNYYLFNQSDFKIPETRDFWIARFPSSQTASDFFNSNYGKDFKTFDEFRLATESLGGKPTEINIGKDKATDVLAQFFSENLTEGTLLQPLEVQGQWWVIYIKKVSKERVKTYEEALPEIKEIIISKKLVEKVEKFINDTKEKVKSTQDFESVFDPISEKIYREKIVAYIGMYPIIGASPEIEKSVLSREQNFIFPKPIQKEKKIYVVFIGEHIPSQDEFTRFLMFDTEKFIQDSVIFVLNQYEIKPKSKDEAIKVLSGR
ncbi:MAG: peptidylprolyl isomerase [Candidatus Calescibacterium sp.]|nr:peptidylprolyl isomerase [Candidatus Calescibacterium sp.]MCX7734206.1 peptidylprolyl isomerase [bacterium]